MMTKYRSLFVLLLVSINIFAQRNDHFIFQSAPSFHNGFKVELVDGDILRFTTQDNYHLLNSLKLKNSELPIPSDYDDFLKENQHLLTNSSFEAQLDVNVKKHFVEEMNRLITISRSANDKKIGYDCISFTIDNYDGKPAQIWSPEKDSEEVFIIMEFLDYMKRLYRPNAMVDQHLFETRFYIDEDNIFELLNTDPVYIRFYNVSLPYLYCQKLTDLINKLPDADLIYLDFSQVTRALDKDLKECFVKEFNRKYKKVKLIQTEEVGEFNSIR